MNSPDSALPRLAQKHLEQGEGGQIRLKTAERKRILINNIFGVDIDPQAVEVAKLSLLLKVIEGQGQMELDIGRILPDLDKNIVCGNSLVGPDFPMPFALTRTEELAFNPFSWEEAFPNVFKHGGFDAVIGNPPYLNIDSVWGKKDPRLSYIKSNYSAVYSDKTDILFYFLKKAVDICAGEIGFIVSRSFLEADKAQNLRGWLSKNAQVREVLDFRLAPVFPKVGINTAIIRLTKSKAVKRSRFARFSERQLPPAYRADTLRDPDLVTAVSIPTGELSSSSWNFGDDIIRPILAKIDKAGTPVGEILHMGEGMQTGRNGAFRFEASEQRTAELLETGLLYPRLRNSDIHAYRLRNSRIGLLYVEDAPSFNSLPQDIRTHLKAQRPDLEQRAAFLRGNCDWWRYTWPLHKDYFDRPRIWCPYRATTNRFALDEHRTYLGLTDTTVLYENGQPEDLRYILGILNSRIATARFRFIGKLLGGGVLEYYENTVSRLSIPRRQPGDDEHDQLVDLVSRRTVAAYELDSTKLNDEKDTLLEECRQLDSSIEDIVAGLFGLSPADVDELEAQLT